MLYLGSGVLLSRADELSGVRVSQVGLWAPSGYLGQFVLDACSKTLTVQTQREGMYENAPGPLHRLQG